MNYLKEQCGDDFGDIMRKLIRHPDVDEHVAQHRTPEEMAIMVIGADLSLAQFDYLCKKVVPMLWP